MNSEESVYDEIIRRHRDFVARRGFLPDVMWVSTPVFSEIYGLTPHEYTIPVAWWREIDPIETVKVMKSQGRLIYFGRKRKVVPLLHRGAPVLKAEDMLSIPPKRPWWQFWR